MLFKLSQQLEKKNENEVNINEEIIPKDRKIGRPNLLFLSISEDRRKQMQMKKLAGWDSELVMPDSVVGGILLVF